MEEQETDIDGDSGVAGNKKKDRNQREDFIYYSELSGDAESDEEIPIPPRLPKLKPNAGRLYHTKNNVFEKNQTEIAKSRAELNIQLNQNEGENTSIGFAHCHCEKHQSKYGFSLFFSSLLEDCF